MVVKFENHTIKLSSVSSGFWQSEILDNHQQLVGCTCDRTPDSTLSRAKGFINELLFQAALQRKQQLLA